MLHGAERVGRGMNKALPPTPPYPRSTSGHLGAENTHFGKETGDRLRNRKQCGVIENYPFYHIRDPKSWHVPLNGQMIPVATSCLRMRLGVLRLPKLRLRQSPWPSFPL